MDESRIDERKLNGDLIPRPKTKFIRVKCSSCGNEQNIFSAASTPVKCIVCNHELASTGASKIRLKAKVVKVYE
ncbi:MAG: 30S ribosomal protein S27e [Candidatus Diapherotrites archaeon]